MKRRPYYAASVLYALSLIGCLWVVVMFAWVAITILNLK